MRIKKVALLFLFFPNFISVIFYQSKTKGLTLAFLLCVSNRKKILLTWSGRRAMNFCSRTKKRSVFRKTDNLISSSAHKNRLILLCFRILKYFGFPKEIKLFLLFVFSIRNLMDAFGAMVTEWKEILCKIDPKGELLQKQNCIFSLRPNILTFCNDVNIKVQTFKESSQFFFS